VNPIVLHMLLFNIAFGGEGGWPTLHLGAQRERPDARGEKHAISHSLQYSFHARYCGGGVRNKMKCRREEIIIYISAET
jgi:hypothetical protein